MNEIAADLHTHTIASGHALDTLRTVCDFALKKGLQGIATTDHGPGIPGGANVVYFIALPKLIESVNLPLRIISGVEDDIQNRRGELALPNDVRKNLEIVMTGCHPFTWMADQNRRVRTEAVINAMTKGNIKLFTHPIATYYDIELDPVTDAAICSKVALELNSRNLSERKPVVGFLEKCAKKSAPIVVNSDAHTAEEVGLISGALELLSETGFPLELVINRSPASISTFFGFEWD